MASQSQIVFLLLFTTNIASLILAEDSTHGQNWKKNFTNIGKNVIKRWEFELDDKIEYPRGDEAMLRRISSLWSEYYACSTRLARSLTPSNRLPSVIQSSHAGALAQLPCGVCVAPGESGAVEWVYSPSVSSPFSPLEPDERIVMADNGNLTLFNVRESDVGAYRCTMGQSAGGTVILAVVNENEPYNVVKPSTSRGPYATPPRQFQYNGLTLLAFTSWSPWSDCSVCGDVGRRRRYGMCYVKTSRRNYQSYIGKKAAKTNRSQDLLNEDNLFKEFPGGLPCRCRTLPLRLRRLPVVATRRNEIMIGLCKVPCEKGSVYEVRSSSGALLERANNTLGVYSLSQRLPLESPSPTSETVFAVVGKRLTLKCPGTSLRDMPVNWQVGTKKLVPRDADKSSGGRVHVNARDWLVFTEVMYGDANLYSCWQRDALVGTVKLEVWDSSPYWNRHVMMLATLLGAAAVFRVADDLLRNKRRRGTPM